MIKKTRHLQKCLVFFCLREIVEYGVKNNKKIVEKADKH